MNIDRILLISVSVFYSSSAWIRSTKAQQGHSMLPSFSNRIAVFVYSSVASWEHLSGKRKIHSELWTTKPRENKEDELPEACQIQSEQHEDSSRRQSEGSQNRSRLQTASACMANWAACVTRLYEHVNKTAANRDTVMAAQRHRNDDSSSPSQPVDTSKSWADLGFPCLKITFKAIKLAEFLLQERFGTIADFSLYSCPNFYF